MARRKKLSVCGLCHRFGETDDRTDVLSKKIGFGQAHAPAWSCLVLHSSRQHRCLAATKPPGRTEAPVTAGRLEVSMSVAEETRPTCMKRRRCRRPRRGSLQRLPISENPIIGSPSRWRITTCCVLTPSEAIATIARKPSRIRCYRT